MTRTFIDKETGEEFQQDGRVESYAPGALVIIPKPKKPEPKKPEPKMEVGDWYQAGILNGPIVSWAGSGKDVDWFILGGYMEVRKANGEVWKKEQGEWVKL